MEENPRNEGEDERVFIRRYQRSITCMTLMNFEITSVRIFLSLLLGVLPHCVLNELEPTNRGGY